MSQERRRRLCTAGIALCLVGLASCTATAPSPGPEVGAPPAKLSAPVGAALGRWIQIKKRERQLVLYDDTEPIRIYPIVLGADPDRAKLYEGDNRTPEGEYHIAAMYPHPLWSRFMLIDYPTPLNRDVYEWSRESGLLPSGRGGAPGIGGQVGIHGTVNDSVNRQGENWTRGCISLLNHDVEELYTLVGVGTRVVIEK